MRIKKISAFVLALFMGLIATMASGCERVASLLFETKSVISAQINENGELVLTYSDNTVQNLGVVKGADGKDGVNGKDGENGKDGTNGKDGKDGADGKDGKDLTACEHAYGDWKTELSPTCNSLGYATRSCTLCGELEYDIDQATGHSYGNAVDVVSDCTAHWTCQTCTLCGDTKLLEAEVTAEHSYNENGECIVCGRDFIDFSELTYVAFGDSITYGVDGVSGNPRVMDSPYPKLVGETLGLKSVTNKAVSGATFCENTLNRTNMTQTILNFKGEADIISLMLGVNDYAVSLPLGTTESRDNTTIYGSLYLIAEHFSTYYSDSFVFFMTPFQYRNGVAKNSLGYVLEDVANAVKHVAQEYDIPVLDMYAEGKYETEMNNANSDGLHPSQDFFKEYTAPQIVEFIKKTYKDNTSTNDVESKLADGELTVLAIGSSYLVDSMKYVYDICSELGIPKIKLGNLYIGGCPMDDHVNNYLKALPNYTYYENSNGTWTTKTDYKMSTALLEREWDYVIINQGGHLMGLPEAYGNFSRYLSIIRKECPDSIIGFNAGWAYAEASTLDWFEPYKNSQSTMYSAICDTMRNVVSTCSAIKFIIPNMTAVQNIRTSKVVEGRITRDPHSYGHMTDDLGCYMVSLTTVSTMLNMDISNISFVPSGVSAEEKAIAIESAVNAIKCPYQTKSSSYQ